MFSYRLALPALCLSLLLPLASPALATETETEAQPKPAVREPLPERSYRHVAFAVDGGLIPRLGRRAALVGRPGAFTPRTPRGATGPFWHEPRQ